MLVDYPPSFWSRSIPFEVVDLFVVGRRAAFGASCPFQWVLANVPSPNPQWAFAAGNNLLGQALRACLKSPHNQVPRRLDHSPLHRSRAAIEPPAFLFT